MRGAEMATEKMVVVIGGVSEKLWGKQFKQQFRVIDKKQINYALNTASYNGLVIKKWRKSEYDKQQNKGI